MPCYDSRSDPEYVAAETRKESQAYIDKLTRLLCKARTLYYDENMAVPADLDQWWEEHKKVDIEREKRGKR